MIFAALALVWIGGFLIGLALGLWLACGFGHGEDWGMWE